MRILLLLRSKRKKGDGLAFHWGEGKLQVEEEGWSGAQGDSHGGRRRTRDRGAQRAITGRVRRERRLHGLGYKGGAWSRSYRVW